MMRIFNIRMKYIPYVCKIYSASLSYVYYVQHFQYSYGIYYKRVFRSCSILRKVHVCLSFYKLKFADKALTTSRYMRSKEPTLFFSLIKITGDRAKIKPDSSRTTPYEALRPSDGVTGGGWEVGEMDAGGGRERVRVGGTGRVGRNAHFYTFQLEGDELTD